MCNRNQVSVSGTETKVLFQYWYQRQIFFCWNWNFYFQSISIFFMFIYLLFLGGYGFLKALNWTHIFKLILKILNSCQQIWFKGPFYDWKNTPYYRKPDFSFEMWFRYQLRYRLKVSNNLGFGIEPKPK